MRTHLPHFKVPISGGRLFLLLALSTLLAGCVSPGSSLALRTPAHHPENIYRTSPILPLDLKRVVVLPLSRDPARPELGAGAGILEPLLEPELIKTARFEVVRPPLASLLSHTGRPAWDAEDTLPADFLTWLRGATGCDAVLFCRLTAFRGYTPLAVGWRMRLVEVQTGATLWAAEDVFDAGQATIQVAARRYHEEQQNVSDVTADEWVMKTSPRLFGRYTLAQLLATLPAR